MTRRAAFRFRPTCALIFGLVGCGSSPAVPVVPQEGPEAVAEAQPAEDRSQEVLPVLATGSPATEASLDAVLESAQSVVLFDVAPRGAQLMRGTATIDLTPATSRDEIIQTLGMPDRVENIDGAELSLWDSLGISVRREGASIAEIGVFLRSSGLTLPFSDEPLVDPAEPRSLFTGEVRVGGAALPADAAAFSPSGMTCDAPSNNHRCTLNNRTRLFLSPHEGPPALVGIMLNGPGASGSR